MSKFAFFNVPAIGHINPTLAVVEELIKRGHEVWYYSFEMAEEKVKETGATFIACDDYMPVSSSEVEDMLEEDFISLAEMAVDTTVSLKEKVYRELDDFQPDCIVYDSLCIWGQLYAKDLGIPYICSTTTFAMNRHSIKEMKPEFKELFEVITGLPRISKKMNMLQENGFDVSNIKNLFELIQNDNDTHTLVFVSEEFQPKVETFSNKYAFVGPSFQVPENKEGENNSPSIYISLGSMLNDKEEFYQRCIEALKELNYEIIMTVGEETDREKFNKLPENIKMYSKVDQLKVLQQAQLFITHSGMNSMNESLYFAVPSVLYPLHSEEEMIAKQVEELGAGKIIESDSVEGIKKAVLEVLNNRSYKRNARKVAKNFHEAGGSMRAAEKIEEFTKS